MGFSLRNVGRLEVGDRHFLTSFEKYDHLLGMHFCFLAVTKEDVTVFGRQNSNRAFRLDANLSRFEASEGHCMLFQAVQNLVLCESLAVQPDQRIVAAINVFEGLKVALFEGIDELVERLADFGFRNRGGRKTDIAKKLSRSLEAR
jgi:hypothetical protein